ncbi:pyridoxal phosphate-dependent enzyme [Actinoplanes sp. SE50]|uniref:aminotransferase class I/II-fold pyridoxal phosphate-dependent enzyme n=1 Tax=unclassified Actinoplanes TaxID=2626549 RepID=UPI00023EDFEA|nr:MULTISPECIES: aminotransferase class I/II-fold pyridoxal phosphate-dependent enzyme [unclassified Actinoplanes]AEV88371.1 pyridoxal phosphate-dependent enzyme [Actinoplanes sp. SE50/110]ATO86776.1 pyridoxal phosphate-dependent enzyme [Actinoplanes sp. SE50]SLM04194.1 pyridoxal phosphate-dependent enzyme [Actinoplanes sp. SE50/110]
MITDFPSAPLTLPDPEELTAELAALGGPAIIPPTARRTIFPVITKEDVFNLLLAQRADPQQVVADFAEAYRSYVGARYALPTASGTSSLHLALIGAGVQPGDEVIVPAFTFIATAQAVVAAHAVPVFVDIDPRTYCLDPAAAEAAITGRTRAIMPVHVHGLPADVPALRALADRHGLALVEDASHAHSARIGDAVAGSFGDAAGQSLMADKNFPLGGEGGIAFFDSEAGWRRAVDYVARHGIDYRMSWVAAAFGASQLKRLPYYDEIRARNSRVLADALDGTGLFAPPFVPPGHTHAYNMYRITLHPAAAGLDDLPGYAVKEAVHELLVAEGVPAREWQNTPIPCHLPFQRRTGFGGGYPFTLNPAAARDHRPEDFPVTLGMLDSTLVLCRELRSPVEYERILRYADAFRKVARRPDAIRKLVADRDYRRPYEKAARLG